MIWGVEVGYAAVESPVSVPDLHATLLHLVGLDHTKLTSRFNGRDERLTDVSGTVMRHVPARQATLKGRRPVCLCYRMRG